MADGLSGSISEKIGEKLVRTIDLRTVGELSLEIVKQKVEEAITRIDNLKIIKVFEDKGKIKEIIIERGDTELHLVVDIERFKIEDLIYKIKETAFRTAVMLAYNMVIPLRGRILANTRNIFAVVKDTSYKIEYYKSIRVKESGIGRSERDMYTIHLFFFYSDNTIIKN